MASLLDFWRRLLLGEENDTHFEDSFRYHLEQFDNVRTQSETDRSTTSTTTTTTTTTTTMSPETNNQRQDPYIARRLSEIRRMANEEYERNRRSEWVVEPIEPQDRFIPPRRRPYGFSVENRRAIFPVRAEFQSENDLPDLPDEDHIREILQNSMITTTPSGFSTYTTASGQALTEEMLNEIYNYLSGNDVSNEEVKDINKALDDLTRDIEGRKKSYKDQTFIKI